MLQAHVRKVGQSLGLLLAGRSMSSAINVESVFSFLRIVSCWQGGPIAEQLHVEIVFGSTHGPVEYAIACQGLTCCLYGQTRSVGMTVGEAGRFGERTVPTHQCPPVS